MEGFKRRSSCRMYFFAMILIIAMFGVIAMMSAKTRADEDGYYTITYDANGGYFEKDGEKDSTYTEKIAGGYTISLRYGYYTTTGVGGNGWIGMMDERGTFLIDIQELDGPTYPKRDGYVCVGWALVGKENEMEPDEITGYKAVLNYTVFNDTEFVAVWEKLVTVELDYNGGTDKEGNTSKTIVTGFGWLIRQYDNGFSKEREVSTITKEGYEITGWKDKETGEVIDDPQIYYQAKKDVTLEAIWSPLVKITFEAGEGHVFANNYFTKGKKDGDETYTKSVFYRGKGTDFCIDEFSGNNYHYPNDQDGNYCYAWTVKGDASGKLYYFAWGVEVTIEKETTFVAVWGEPTIVDHDLNGGLDTAYSIGAPTLEIQNYQCVGTLTRVARVYEGTKPEEQMLKPGMVMTGWKIKDSTDNKLYLGKDLIVVEKDMVMVAQWEPATDQKLWSEYNMYFIPYTIRYETNGGSFVDDVTQKNLFSDEGEWRAFFVSPEYDYEAKSYVDSTIKVGCLDTDLTDEWYKDNVDVWDEIEEKDYHICKPFKVEKQGYKFLGWKLEGDKTNKLYAQNEDYSFRFERNDENRYRRGDVIFVAQWEKLPDPTNTPTPVTTVTKAPTISPTPATATPVPSGEPTKAPTVSPVPSGEPTKVPTTEPTPTQAPTSEGTIEQFAERLYTVALGRESDAEGLKYWSDEIKNGNKTGGECAHFFLIDAPEFLNRGLSEEEFVETLYKTFFGRDSEPAGKAYWVGELKKGTKTKEDVINGFIDSTEWCNICASYGVKSGAPNAKAEVASQNAKDFATRLYTCCLNRGPEKGGLAYWSLALTNLEQTGCSAAKFFFTGDEFVGFGLKNDEYVRRLYTTFMGRDPEASEVAYWVGEIKKGTQTKDSVLAFFGQSPEFTNICKKYGIDRGTI